MMIVARQRICDAGGTSSRDVEVVKLLCAPSSFIPQPGSR